MPLLTVDSLSVVYGQGTDAVAAVQGVSFAVEAGEILALVGESGSGKTSVGLALTKLLPPSAAVSGRVVFEGADVLDQSEEALRRVRGRRISYVFQEPEMSLNPVLTIGEQLVEAITTHTSLRGEAARQRALAWLQRVGIREAEARRRAYPHEFSGGMQQRVMLAMALACLPAPLSEGQAGEPTLLVADEPTTALDVTVQVQILRLLRDLQRSLRLAMLLISHDLLVVERLARRVGVMAGGRLLELGPTEQVLRRPAHPQTQRLLRSRSMISLGPHEGNGHG